MSLLAAALPPAPLAAPAWGRRRPEVKCPQGHSGHTAQGIPAKSGGQLIPSGALEEMPPHTTSPVAGTTTSVMAVSLVLLLCTVACAHPVPAHEPARSPRSGQQEDAPSEDYVNKLGNILRAGDDRRPPAGVERGDNTLARDSTSGNAVVQKLGEHGGRDKGGRVGEVQHLNQVDHEAAAAQDGNSLDFLEEDARDADNGDNGEHYGAGVNWLPSHTGGLLDEEDDSGDDTFDENGKEEGGEGPTYVAGADGAGEHGHDAGHGDARAGGGHGDSSSSSSSESFGADHWRYRSYPGRQNEQASRWGGGSSSSQEEEESYDFEDEAMQGDDPSILNSWGSSYKGRRTGPRALGTSQEGGWAADSHRWEEGNSRSPEVEDTDSGEDSPSTEDNSESEEPVTSQSEEYASHSREDGNGEDSPSKESEGSKSREDTADPSDEESRESPEDISQEVVSTSSERSGSRSQEGQEDQESAMDRSAQSMPDSKSEEDEDDQSKSREDDGNQSQSTEDTVEDENDSDPDGDVPSTSTESQSASPEDDGSHEDNTGEDTSSTESNNSESQEEDDDDDKSYSQEDTSQDDTTHESSSRGDNSSPQSLETRSHKRRPGAYRRKPAVDYDDNDCQDGY